jgi:primosomal protein N'
MNLPIAQVVFGLPVEGPFDYLIPEDLVLRAAPGQRVAVRFAGKKRVGVIVRLLSKTEHAGRLSVLIKILDEEPVFSPAFLKLSEIFSEKFACTQGESLETFLPAYLRKPRLFKGAVKAGTLRAESSSLPALVFDRGQAQRWEVLLPRIAKTLHDRRGVLVLVPDATRCPDVLPKLGPLVSADERVLITQGTEKEEYARWLSIRSGQARLVVGFISAVFAPVKDLGLIVVIEEGNPFYKHDQSPFYHAREVAFDRAAIEGCEVLCVSSAPSVELWHKAEMGLVRLTLLDEKLPPVNFLDLTNFKMKKGTFVSLGLRNHIEAVIKDGRKVLLYIQAARGVSSVMEEVKRSFSAARVVGYDKASLKLPDDFDIIVTTQAMFRHRSSLKVAVAAVLDIDWEFHKHDHQAAHGAFALVQHLRQMAQERVLLQTRQVSDPLLHTLASDDAHDFYRQELTLRGQMGLPPFMTIVTVIVRSADPALACTEAKRLYDMLMPVLPEEVMVLEPQQDRSPIVRGKFRYCVSVQGPDRTTAVRCVKGALKTFRPKKDTVVTVNVDGP